MEPKKAASPKEKIPPSVPSSQYPAPFGVTAAPVIGRAGGLPASDPSAGTDPNG